MRILVADDDAGARLITKTMLGSLGHDCDLAVSGAVAWEHMRDGGYDMVISDWMMPGMSGLELCRKLRAGESDSYTYFTMVTGRGASTSILAGMDAGVDHYLVKPLDVDALHCCLIAADRVTTLHRQLAEQRVEMRGLNEELQSLARRDPLTGLGNRRALQQDLELLEERAERYGHRFCMALFDVDHFKSYNDTFGHPAGDQALRAVAEQLRGQLRKSDTVYRYGGEEFLCVFPEQSVEQGAYAVERMRNGVEELSIPHPGSEHAVLTMSAGLAMLDPACSGSADELLQEADRALYRAKQLGRNRVELSVTQTV
jgi:two-component system chemotaxis response regulator CheY